MNTRYQAAGKIIEAFIELLNYPVYAERVTDDAFSAEGAADDAPGDAVEVPQLMLLIKTAVAVTSAMRDVLSEFGLTESTGALLWTLAPDTEPVTMRELARKLNFDPSNITLLGDRLEQAGLAERRPSPADGRARVLALTAAGEQVWRRLVGAMLRTSPLAQLSPPERRQLHVLLSKMQT